MPRLLRVITPFCPVSGTNSEYIKLKLSYIIVIVLGNITLQCHSERCVLHPTVEQKQQAYYNYYWHGLMSNHGHMKKAFILDRNQPEYFCQTWVKLFQILDEKDRVSFNSTSSQCILKKDGTSLITLKIMFRGTLLLRKCYVCRRYCSPQQSRSVCLQNMVSYTESDT